MRLDDPIRFPSKRIQNIIFKGPGSRKYRVHIFDEFGCFIGRGYMRDNKLFTKEELQPGMYTIRAFRQKNARGKLDS